MKNSNVVLKAERNSQPRIKIQKGIFYNTNLEVAELNLILGIKMCPLKTGSFATKKTISTSGGAFGASYIMIT